MAQPCPATERAPAGDAAGGSAAEAAACLVGDGDTASLQDALSDGALLRRSWSEFEKVPLSDAEELELRGGYGEVLKRRRVGAATASDGGGPAAPDAFVAVKTLLHKAGSARGLQEEAELLKELLAYRRLGRPVDEEGWCPLVAFLGLLPPCAASGRSYGLVLEWYGVSLARVLDAPPDAFDAAARRTVARHVALACRFLHDQGGIVHRDIKVRASRIVFCEVKVRNMVQWVASPGGRGPPVRLLTH